jgi:hypothetical protein
VSAVIASGREVVRDGAHVAMDVPRELEAAIRKVWE